MTLRSRISLALLVIAVILVSPALLGLSALREIREITESLRARDAAGAFALGELQAAFNELRLQQRSYLPFLITRPVEADRARLRAQIDDRIARFEDQLDVLARVQYAEAAQTTRQRWEQLKPALAEERRLVDAGEFDAAEQFRLQTVEPGYSEVEQSIAPIAVVINRAIEQRAEEAEALADRSVTTTLIALALALAVGFLIAALLARSLLRPIHELRTGMSMVAGGEFEPRLRLDPSRPDELGDLARSFKRMTRQLSELDRLKAEFVSVASHELKTPLSVIKGYVSLLLDGIYGVVPDNQRKVLGSVSDQTDRLGRLIQQLLDISRFEAGGGRLEIQPIDLRHFLLDLATSFEALAVQNQITFQLETEDDLPDTLNGDPDRLNEVVGNLLSNAFKFTARGGEIRLLAGAEENGVTIEVEDSGVGIPRDQLPRIFEKFYQVENTAQPKSIGSGLGLAISREIVEAHGGTIAAESEEGRGTTFRVFLPFAAQAQ